MAKKTLNNLETYGIIRNKINDNFTDLYTNKSDENHTHEQLHTHANKNQIDKIGEDVDGKFTYNGLPIECGSGTSDYKELSNKPTINNIELSENKTLADLGIQPSGDYLTEIPSEYVTDAELESKSYATTSQIPDVSNKLEISNILQGTNIILNKVGNDITINSTCEGGSGGSIVTDSETNGNIVIDGSETNIYTLPSDVAKTSDLHYHDNKTTLDGITSEKITQWNTVVGKIDKVEGMGLSTNDYTTDDKDKLSGIDFGANKYIHPNDVNTRHVTDTEKEFWNGKSDFSGDYNDLLNLPSVLGDMTSDVYDPQGKAVDVFEYTDNAIIDKIDKSEKGVTIATLVDGKVPSEQLPPIPSASDITYDNAVSGLNATNVQEAIDENSSQLAQKANQVDLVVERERINLIQANPGSTSGDLALNDIKIGADGKTYNSPGDAVRGQFGVLKNVITTNTDDIRRIDSGLDSSSDIKSYNTIANRRINSDGTTSSSADRSKINMYRGLLPGEKIYVSVDGDSGIFVPVVYAWYTSASLSAENLISASGSGAYKGYMTVPDGATVLAITSLADANNDYVKRATWVTPEMFGAVGDGITNDAVALQEAIDYCITYDKILKLVASTYGTASTISIIGRLNIIGVNSWIKYIGAIRIQNLIYIKCPSLVTYPEQIGHKHRVMFNVDGNNLVNVGIYTENMSEYVLDTIIIKNVKGCLYVHGGCENVVNNCYFRADASNESYGLYADGSDNFFNDIYMYQTHTGVIADGTNHYVGIHPWNASNLAGSIGLKILNGKSLWTNICVDTFQYGIWKENKGVNIFTKLKVYYAENYYTPDLPTPTIFYSAYNNNGDNQAFEFSVLSDSIIDGVPGRVDKARLSNVTNFRIMAENNFFDSYLDVDSWKYLGSQDFKANTSDGTISGMTVRNSMFYKSNRQVTFDFSITRSTATDGFKISAVGECLQIGKVPFAPLKQTRIPCIATYSGLSMSTIDPSQRCVYGLLSIETSGVVNFYPSEANVNTYRIDASGTYLYAEN